MYLLSIISFFAAYFSSFTFITLSQDDTNVQYFILKFLFLFFRYINKKTQNLNCKMIDDSLKYFLQFK